MVYLFGGGFLVGGSQGANFLDNYLYSGEEIADRGNVIVVTVNYRVGALGFLSTGDSDLPGETHNLDTVPGCLLLYITYTSSPLIRSDERCFTSADFCCRHNKDTIYFPPQ